MSRVPWPDMERLLYEQMEGTVNNDPRVLLETDVGPVGRKADVILARLYERDGQSVRDVRLTRVETEVLVPIPLPLRMLRIEAVGPDDFMPPKAARFVLQSSFAETKIAPEFAPPWITPGPPDFMTSVLFVRYRRR